MREQAPFPHLDEIARLKEELAQSRADLAEARVVVDAAREVVEIRSCTNRLRKALRALDGEP